MNKLFDHPKNDVKNRLLARQNGIRPVPRATPADHQPSDTRGAGPFDFVQSVGREHSFVAIAAYSLVILVALGYVPGLGL